MSNTNTVAGTIFEQLGGLCRLVAMAGAKDFVDHGNGASFKLGRGASNGITHALIELGADDLYTVKFLRVTKRGLEVRTIDEHEGIYADMLKALFERDTGFYLSI